MVTASNVFNCNSVSGTSEKKKCTQKTTIVAGDKNEYRNHVKESIDTLLRIVLGHTVTGTYKEIYVTVIAIMNIKLQNNVLHFKAYI